MPHRLKTLEDKLAGASTAEQVAEVIVMQGMSTLDANVGIVAILNETRTEFHSLKSQVVSRKCRRPGVVSRRPPPCRSLTSCETTIQSYSRL